jgi:hypothetical protein
MLPLERCWLSSTFAHTSGIGGGVFGGEHKNSPTLINCVTSGPRVTVATPTSDVLRA